MKTQMMIAALVVATAAAGITIARADQGDDTGLGGGWGHGHHRNRQALLDKYDVNHNGVLDPEEKEAARKDWEARKAQRQARLLEKDDANHNGVLDPEEKEAIKADRQARRRDTRRKNDTDGHAKPSREERHAPRND